MFVYCSTRTTYLAALLYLQVTGFGYEHDEAWAANMELFKEFTDVSRGVRRLGAAAVDLCHVALGRFRRLKEIVADLTQTVPVASQHAHESVCCDDCEGYANFTLHKGCMSPEEDWPELLKTSKSLAVVLCSNKPRQKS